MNDTLRPYKLAIVRLLVEHEQALTFAKICEIIGTDSLDEAQKYLDAITKLKGEGVVNGRWVADPSPLSSSTSTYGKRCYYSLNLLQKLAAL